MSEADPTGNLAGTSGSLANWAGDYVTDMLGKGWGLSEEPYQVYPGELTAGPTSNQLDAFSGIAGLTVPGLEDNTFTPRSFTDAGVAGEYMNPYIQQALEPTIAELTRQNTLQRLEDQARLGKAGAYGGSRQAIMDAERTRNLNRNLADVVGEGYAQAYTQGANQFNTEERLGLDATGQTQNYGLANLAAGQDLFRDIAEMGEVERQIEQQGIDADRANFEEQRLWPYKQVQFQQSLLQGLPISAKTQQYIQPSGFSNFLSGTGGIMDLLSTLFGGGSDGGGTAENPDAGEMGQGTLSDDDWRNLMGV